MNTQHHKRLWMSAIALLLSVGQGCSSHSVGYTVDSESGPQGMGEESAVVGMVDQDGTSAYGSGDYEQGRSFYESGESYDPGAVGSPQGYKYSGVPYGTDVSNGAYNGLQYIEPGSGLNSDGSDYGHNYSGVPGYGSNNGPVTGFGNGFAESVNPNPEAWAEAFLRGNDNDSGESMSNGGLTSEHVGQDVLVAKSNPYASDYGIGNQSPGSHGSSMNNRYGSGTSGGHVEDVYFAFDSWKISRDGAKSLEADAEWLKNHPGQFVTIEGHCDQRGTQDYNMVLGKKRAEAAKEYLVDLGVNSSQLKVVSYGKERPFCSEHNEFCYQQNRRGHIAVRN